MTTPTKKAARAIYWLFCTTIATLKVQWLFYAVMALAIGVAGLMAADSTDDKAAQDNALVVVKRLSGAMIAFMVATWWLPVRLAAIAAGIVGTAKLPTAVVICVTRFAAKRRADSTALLPARSQYHGGRGAE